MTAPSARRYGPVYDRERIEPLLTGRPVLEGMHIMQREYGLSSDPKGLPAECIAIAKDPFAWEFKFIGGLEVFFRRVRNRYKTCIATTMTGDLLAAAHRRPGLSRLSAGRTFSLADVVCRAKPNPDLVADGYPEIDLATFG